MLFEAHLEASQNSSFSDWLSLICICVYIQSGVMATFEVTTDTDSITITWTNNDVQSLANFTIALDRVVRYTGGSGSRYSFRMSGLTAGARYIVEIHGYTTAGQPRTPVGAYYTLSMLSSNENVSAERRT